MFDSAFDLTFGPVEFAPSAALSSSCAFDDSFDSAFDICTDVGGDTGGGHGGRGRVPRGVLTVEYPSFDDELLVLI